jgi:mono/diheme cytochrome c family protein
MVKRSTWMKGLSTSTLLWIGCGGAQTGTGGTTPVQSAPTLVVTDPGEWQSLTTSGKDTFDVSCGSCHPGGDADLGPALKGHAVPMDEMVRQIREGSGRMKPIDEKLLPEGQMRGLMVYLATLEAVSGVKGP